MKLVIGNKYKWKHETLELVFLGRKGQWNVFASCKTNKVWCEVLDSDLHLIEAVKHDQFK